jgi:hypothetical protein
MALHHKLCHTLGGSFDLPHAETHAVVLPHAIAYNARAVPDLLAPVTRSSAAPIPVGRFRFRQIHGAPLALRSLGEARRPRPKPPSWPRANPTGIRNRSPGRQSRSVAGRLGRRTAGRIDKLVSSITGRKTMITRRTLLKTSAATGLTIAAAVWPHLPSHRARSIKLGYVSPQSGPLAAFAEADSFILSNFARPEAAANFEVIVKDSQSNPNRAAEVAKELIVDDEVDMMLVASTPETTNPVATTAKPRACR